MGAFTKRILEHRTSERKPQRVGTGAASFRRMLGSGNTHSQSYYGFFLTCCSTSHRFYLVHLWLGGNHEQTNLAADGSGSVDRGMQWRWNGTCVRGILCWCPYQQYRHLLSAHGVRD